MKLTNRNAVVIKVIGVEASIIIGPFKKYITAVERRDQIIEYLLDSSELEDGEDYQIHAIGCHATSTTNEEIEQLIGNLIGSS